MRSEESSNMVSERRGTRQDNDILKLLFHIFFDILFLVIAAEILLELTGSVLDNPDEIITKTSEGIFSSVNSYIVELDPYSETVYAMLLTAGVLGLYIIMDIINNIKNEEKIILTPEFRRTLIILLLFMGLYTSYKFLGFDIKNIVFAIIFSIIYVKTLYEYAIKDIVSKTFEDYESSTREKTPNTAENRFQKYDIYILLIIPFMILLLFFCLFPPMILDPESSTTILDPEFLYLFFSKRLLLSLIVFTLAIYMISESLREESPEKTNEKEDKIIKYMGNRIKEHIINKMKELIKDNWLSTGIFGYSLFLYIIICLFFFGIRKDETDPYSGVLTLLGVAILISVGFSMCGYTISRIVKKNESILLMLGVSIGEGNSSTSEVSGEEGKEKESGTSEVSGEEGKEKTLMEKLRKHINNLLLNFLIAISSYIFLSSLLKTLFPKSILLSDLNLILFIPMYYFFFKAGPAIAESIYKKIYKQIEKKTELSYDKKRRDSFVKVFVTLTKATIVISIVLHALSRFGILGTIKDFISTPPISYLIQLAIAVPITMQVLVLILDPFFEGETIEMGSNTGKIKNVGFLFTKMETMKGEHIYIPNAELLARTIRRLNIRGSKDTEKEEGKSQDKRDKEKGVMIHFSCTLSYDYKPKDIKKIFKAIFEEKSKKEEDGTEKDRKEELKTYLSGIGYEDVKEQLDFIFSTGASHPFVFIENFKDHGIVYRFNFRVRNALYAPIFRGYFMEEFKLEMNKNKKHIYTPLKHEITDTIPEKDKEWEPYYV